METRITQQTIPAVTEALRTESMLGVKVTAPTEADPLNRRARAISWNRLVLELNADSLPDLSDDAEDELTTDLSAPVEMRTLEIPVGVYAALRAYQATYRPGQGILDIALEAIESRVGL